MKKGLITILEQGPPSGGFPISAESEPSGQESSNDTGNDVGNEEVKTKEVKTKEVSNEVVINQRMSDMFKEFDVFDGQDRDLIKKLSDSDMDAIRGNVIRRLKSELGDDLSNMDNSVLDDTFMNYLLDYMVNEKKMEPFYIQYIPSNVYKLKPKRIVEAKGLLKVLMEQGFDTNRETLYVNYTPSGFEIIGGDGARNEAGANYRSEKGNDDIIPQRTQQQSNKPQQSSEQQSSEPQKRPEDELGVSNIDMIQKKASVEGWAGVKDILKDSKYSGVKRAIEDKMREDYVLTFPGDETLASYEMVDIVKDNPTVFKELGFTSMPMYRMKKKSGDEISQNLSTIIESGRVTNDFCKTAVKTFYELATDDYPIDVENLKSTALYLDRCRDQHGGRWGIGDVEFVDNKLRKSGTQYRLDRMSSLSPEFRINFSDNTVSGQKFK